MDNRGEDRKDFARRSFRKNDGERGEGRRQEHSENFRPRRFERGDDERREGRRDFKKDGYRMRSDRGVSRGRELGALMDLDNDILHLVMRRAQMLARLRRGGRLAPETEKTLRTAWESKAARLARDNRLSRDLFVLLQTIEPLTRMEENRASTISLPTARPWTFRFPRLPTPWPPAAGWPWPPPPDR